jgi:hypothetical protein
MGTVPTLARLTFGFQVFIVLVFAWASFDYNRFIKFWMLKPAPYSRAVRSTFRLFFLACVVGGGWRVFDDMSVRKQSAPFYLSTLPITIAWLCVFFLLLRVVEWVNKKRSNGAGEHEA